MSLSVEKGAKGEAHIISKLTESGWGVAKPLLDLGVDLLAYRIENRKVKVLAIQLKSLESESHENKTCYGFQIDRAEVIQGVTYIIVCPKIGEYLIIPSEELMKKSHWHRTHPQWEKFKEKWDLLS
jgi:hypothetical protein